MASDLPLQIVWTLAIGQNSYAHWGTTEERAELEICVYEGLHDSFHRHTPKLFVIFQIRVILLLEGLASSLWAARVYAFCSAYSFCCAYAHYLTLGCHTFFIGRGVKYGAAPTGTSNI